MGYREKSFTCPEIGNRKIVEKMNKY